MYGPLLVYGILGGPSLLEPKFQLVSGAYLGISLAGADMAGGNTALCEDCKVDNSGPQEGIPRIENLDRTSGFRQGKCASTVRQKLQSKSPG